MQEIRTVTRQIITLFEYQARAYEDIGLAVDHPIIAEIERLNERAGADLILLGRYELRATQYVGVLRVGDITIQVLPKIDYEPAGNPEAPEGSESHLLAAESATHNLLHMLSYAEDLHVREQEVSSLAVRRSDWFELLTRLFAARLHRQAQLGLERTYLSIEETIPFIRGRWLLTQQLVRRPYVKHAFDVAYDEYTMNTPLNQVFAFVVRRLLLASEDPANLALLRDLEIWLGDVQPPNEVTEALLDQVRFDRLNERFQPSYNLARLFVESSVFQLTAGGRQSFALMLDMNDLFERFIAAFLVRHSGRILPQQWEHASVSPQSKGHVYYLARRVPNGQPLLRLVPDVLVTDVLRKPLLALDTKYKRLEAGHTLYGIAESDMYQMLAYIVGLHCDRVLLLYPRWAGAPSAPITLQTMGLDARITAATVDLRQPLVPTDALIRELRALLYHVAYPDLEEVI